MRSLDPNYRLLEVDEHLKDGDEAWVESRECWVDVSEFFGLTSSAGPESINGLGLVQKAQGQGSIFRRKLDVITKLGRLADE